VIDEDQHTRRHVLTELGFSVRAAGDDLHGFATMIPEMAVPGTGLLRTSVLAIWADTLAGLLAAAAMSPRVPVTLELDVQLYRPVDSTGTVHAVGRRVKRGRSVFVAAVDFTTGEGEPIATAGGSFMLAPDPNVRLPDELSINALPRDALLSMPLAERAGCERREPGVAVLPRSEDGLNSSRTVNGGLIALAAEEAALSLTPGAALCSLGLRYLQPVRVGPVVASATVRHGLGRVELRDAGNDDRLSVLATTRIFEGA
jgi:acyl-coenzyme A thioesterase PaaI-like protein